MTRIRTAGFGLLLLLLAGCASTTPPPNAQPTEYLVPTTDFTMRLPPFVGIEVMKTARVSIIGTTQRDGKTFRIAVLPVRAASALRFLINDDGSFEGSAINFTGSKMGYTYAPVPSDVRLVSPTLVPLPTSIGLTPEQIEGVRAALDAHLASSLKDPMSAIQYSSGTPTECRNVADGPVEIRDAWCVCYFVNAKNSMGGFTGSQLGAVSLIGSKPPYLLVDMPKDLITHPAGCKGVVSRDAALIHALVK